MDFNKFKNTIQNVVPVGTVFENPQSGTSKVVSLSDNGLYYVRGKSTIYVSYRDLFDTFQHFRGLRVSSSDLKHFRPSVFDSHAKKPGHSCNCTFFFILVNEIGFASVIKGRGVRGEPYFVELVK